MSQNQINQTINRVTLKTINSSLQNFQIINGLTTVVDNNAKIADLLDNNSDTQILLTSTKTILDYAVSRGLATMELQAADTNASPPLPNIVKYNFNQQYANSVSSTANLTLYQIDLSNFYDATSSTVYENKTNVELYQNGTISNATYIANVNGVISSMQTCIGLVTDIMSTV